MTLPEMPRLDSERLLSRDSITPIEPPFSPRGFHPEYRDRTPPTDRARAPSPAREPSCERWLPDVSVDSRSASLRRSHEPFHRRRAVRSRSRCGRLEDGPRRREVVHENDRKRVKRTRWICRHSVTDEQQSADQITERVSPKRAIQRRSDGRPTSLQRAMARFGGSSIASSVRRNVPQWIASISGF